MQAQTLDQSRSIRVRAAVVVLAMVASFLAVVVGAKSATATPGVDDYPYKTHSWTQADPWGFYKRECTSFVAWRLNNDNGFAFTNNGHGNAGNWGTRAAQLGYAVNMTPAPGSVAWWSSGHVAWVRSVSGSNVIIEEYNWNYTHNYNTRTIAANSVSGYIHYKDLTSADADRNRDGVPDLYAINRHDSGSGKTAYHVVNGANPSQWLHNTATALHPTDANWDFEVADHNRDGVPDVYAINRHDSGSGKTAVHIINGANPSQYLLSSATVLHQTDAMWDFEVADRNGDGTPDIYAINRSDSGSGKTAVHVINGSNPSQWLFSSATVLHATTTLWDFEIADRNQDGIHDIYAINRQDSGSGKTAVHVINGANVNQWLLSSATILHQTDAVWDFEAADHNRDGAPDIYAINRNDSGSGKTAYHVINGANVGQYLQNTATVLHPTTAQWSFGL